jgi:hypothetical protein
MWNAVHPTTFIGAHPQWSLGYLERELMPWLRRMKESGQTVPDYCRNNPGFGSPRLHEGDGSRFHSPILPLQSAGRREVEL